MASLSPQEISQIGEKYYFDALKAKLEETSRGSYLVLDVETKAYEVDSDKLTAIQKAEEKVGKKLFYITRIGDLQTAFFGLKKREYAWPL